MQPPRDQDDRREPLPAVEVGDAHGPADDVVIAAVIAGDLPCFETLMRRYNRRVFRAARAVLRNDHDAEDAAQRAWLNAFRALTQWDSERGRFSTWLLRITVNEATRLARGRRSLSFADGDEQESHALEADPELALERGEVRAVVEAALDTIDPGQRMVLVLRDIEGLTSREVATSLDLSEEAVRVRLHRARRALRLRLEAALAITPPELFPFDGARCDRMVRGVLDALGIARA
jgi:RNA polymerase sigma-70 factor, ECF subfamily